MPVSRNQQIRWTPFICSVAFAACYALFIGVRLSNESLPQREFVAGNEVSGNGSSKTAAGATSPGPHGLRYLMFEKFTPLFGSLAKEQCRPKRNAAYKSYISETKDKPPVMPEANAMEVIGLPDYKVGECAPKQRFYFAKTHKTASGSVAGMLLRYVHLRPEIRFACQGKYNELAVKKGHCFPERFESSAMVSPPYDAFINHMVYAPKFVNTFLPNTARIISLRDPITRTISSLMFWKSYKRLSNFPADMPFEEQVHEWLKPELWNQVKRNRKTFNNMAYDLGEYRDCDECKTQGKALEALTSFDVVVLAERFVEGLVVMQVKLCWSLSDMLYLASHDSGHTSNPYDFLSVDELALVHEVNQVDSALYELGTAMFEAQLAEVKALLPSECEGFSAERVGQPGFELPSHALCFDDHVEYLQRALSEVQALCALGNSEMTASQSDLCAFMNLARNPYEATKKLTDLQKDLHGKMDVCDFDCWERKFDWD